MTKIIKIFGYNDALNFMLYFENGTFTRARWFNLDSGKEEVIDKIFYDLELVQEARKAPDVCLYGQGDSIAFEIVHLTEKFLNKNQIEITDPKFIERKEKSHKIKDGGWEDVENGIALAG